MTAAYAVIGWPLGHTLSPVMHQAALDELGLEATYTALPTPPGTESDRFQDVRTGTLAGLNVTIPHKLAAFRAMDRLTPAARRTGAVNTVIRDDGRLLGDNTDPYGFAEALRQFGDFDPAGAFVVVLGAGGAARAAGLALFDSGAHRIALANRTVARAHELVQDIDPPAGASLNAYGLTDGRLRRDLADAQLLVNTTSVGMAGGPAPATCPVPAKWLHANLFVYDIVYRPAADAAAGRRATPAAHSTLGGLEMLVMQGAASLEAVDRPAGPGAYHAGGRPRRAGRRPTRRTSG